MKQCILVVGMHRSGTSVMAGTLEIMGVDFGDNLIRSDADNIKGYFEHSAIHDANDNLLQELCSSWKDPKPLPRNWLSDSRVCCHREKIRALIAHDFGNSQLFGIKDPRISVLLPLYVEVLNAMAIQPLFVIMERPVTEVAESLYRRDRMPKKQSINLSRKYRDTINTFTIGQKAVRIQFAELLRQPHETLQQIPVVLGVSLQKFDGVRDKLLAFIDPTLKHFDAGKLTRRTLQNRLTKAVDLILPFHTRRREFVKTLCASATRKLPFPTHKRQLPPVTNE